MVFNPERIDRYAGSCSVYQYTHARCCSVLRKAGDLNADSYGAYLPMDKEWRIIRRIAAFADTVEQAAKTLDPSGIAQFA